MDQAAAPRRSQQQDAPPSDQRKQAQSIPPPPLVRAWLLPGLPHVTGPYVVGTTDIEWAEPQFSELVIEGQPALRTTGILARLFYPANQRRGVHPIPYRASSLPGYHHTRWVPHSRYIVGYGDFLKMPRAASYTVLMPMLGSISMPDAYAEAPLLTPEIQATSASGQPDTRSALPVMVFSHGLGGMRSTYSAICAEMASYGWVVVAVEHGDRSACLSIRDDGAHTIEFFRSPKLSDLPLRQAQVQRRIDETFACVELLRRINDGVPIAHGHSSRGGKHATPPIDLASFRGRLDLDRMAVAESAGHSFGGGTAVGASADPRSRFRCVLALDAWMFPLGPDFTDKKERACPVLFINSETFHWKENLDAIHAWAKARPMPPLGEHPDGMVVTLLQTAHQNQSDFPLLLPTILRTMNMAGRLPATTAIHLNNRAMLTFLHWHLPTHTMARRALGSLAPLAFASL